MKKLAVAMLPAAIVAATASATVTYNFAGTTGRTFTLQVDNYITTTSAFDLTKAVSYTGDFNTVQFCLSGSTCISGFKPVGYDEIYLYYQTNDDPTTVTSAQAYDFTAGNFSSNGLHPTITGAAPGLLGVNATLPATAPESSSWLMMIVGFGALGAAMRRHKVAISYA